MGDGLVRAPVKNLDEEHARQQCVPGHGRIVVADQRKTLWRDIAEVPADGVEGEEHDEQAHAQHENAAVGIGNRDGAQSTEHRVRRTHQGKEHSDHQHVDVCACHGNDEQGPGVDHRGLENEHVNKEEHGRHQRANVLAVVAQFQQFRGGGAVVPVVDRQEDFRQHQQPHKAAEFPDCEQQHLVAIHPHQLVRTEVCEGD